MGRAATTELAGALALARRAQPRITAAAPAAIDNVIAGYTPAGRRASGDGMRASVVGDKGDKQESHHEEHDHDPKDPRLKVNAPTQATAAILRSRLECRLPFVHGVPLPLGF